MNIFSPAFLPDRVRAQRIAYRVKLLRRQIRHADDNEEDSLLIRLEAYWWFAVSLFGLEGAAELLVA